MKHRDRSGRQDLVIFPSNTVHETPEHTTLGITSPVWCRPSLRCGQQVRKGKAMNTFENHPGEKVAVPGWAVIAISA